MAIQGLEHVLVGAQLEGLVLLELLRRLLPRGEDERNVLELDVALDLVADRVANLLGLDRDHHQRRPVLLGPINDLVAVGDVLDLETVGFQGPGDNGQGSFVGFHTQKRSRRHEDGGRYYG